MKTLQELTPAELQKLVEDTDTTYDTIEDKHGNYDLWHDIASGYLYNAYGIKDGDYSFKELDEAVISMHHDDHDCDDNLRAEELCVELDAQQMGEL